MHPHIIIIGGGLAGFTAAHRLAQAHPGSIKITLVESKEEVGGRTRSLENGIDMGGAWIWPENVETRILVEEIAVKTFRHPGGVNGEIRIAGGMVQFVKRLKESLVSLSEQGLTDFTLISGAKATRVFLRNTGSIDVHYTSDSTCSILTSDHTIIAIPPRLLAGSLPILKEPREMTPTTPLEPLLSPMRLTAMLKQNIWMASTAKVAFEYSKPWWRNPGVTPVDRVWVRSEHVMQVMDASTVKVVEDVSSGDGVASLVVFAIPPAPVMSGDGLKMWPSPSFTVSNVKNLEVEGPNQLEDGVKEWLSSIIKHVARISLVINPMSTESMHPTRVHVHAWSHDPDVFCDDGKNAPGHPSYFQHPHDGGKYMREPIMGVNTRTGGKGGLGVAVVPKILFASSETDDRYAGFLEGAVRSGNRVAKELESALR
ncbi:hypothetical protein HDU67_001685 [Dinochytrium kinnereticum]|nr:hypothetical protein HDU67_001685 [Dinochytrium kinnereticum]